MIFTQPTLKHRPTLGLQNPKIGRSRNFATELEPPDKHNAIKGSYFRWTTSHRITALGNEVQPAGKQLSTGAVPLTTTPSFDRSKTSRNPKVRQTPNGILNRI